MDDCQTALAATRTQLREQQEHRAELARHLTAEEDRRVTLSRRLSRAGARLARITLADEHWGIRYCMFETSHVRDPRSRIRPFADSVFEQETMKKTLGALESNMTARNSVMVTAMPVSIAL